MSTKWKYATLPANARIDLLRKGRRDVLEEEIARTKSVVKARRELGLDTSEQEKWLDTVGYSYNIGHAKSVGEPEESVAKTGYASVYLGDSSADTAAPKTPVTSVREYKTSARPKTSYISNAKRKIERAGELAVEAAEKRYADKAAELSEAFYGDNSTLREAVLNSGGHDDGGKMASAYRAKAAELGVLLEDKDEEMAREIAKIRRRYADLADTLLDYRKNGTALESLDTIANVLIKNAAIEDGYDSSPITGKASRTAKSSSDTSAEAPVAQPSANPDKPEAPLTRAAAARAKADRDTPDTIHSDTPSDILVTPKSSSSGIPDTSSDTPETPYASTPDTATPEALASLLVEAAKRLGASGKERLLDYLTSRLGIDKSSAEGIVRLILNGNG